MSSGDAKRLATRISSEIMARETLIDALPPGSRVTITVQYGAPNVVKSVRVQTESDIQDALSRNGR